MFEQVVESDDRKLLNSYLRILEKAADENNYQIIDDIYQPFRDIQWIDDAVKKQIEKTQILQSSKRK